MSERPAPTRESSRFLRRLVVAMAAFFGIGTIVPNGLALLATDAARAELGAIPYPLYWFHFAMGWAYVVASVGIARRARWGPSLAWGLAVTHALSASVLWLWFFAGNPVEHGTLAMELGREGFWVLIGLYLWNVGR